MPLQPGDRFGPYEIVAPLGAGGMGEVYRARVADRTADIWAFGCVLFEMLAGRRPFEGESISECSQAS